MGDSVPKLSSEYEILIEIYRRYRGAHQELKRSPSDDEVFVPVDLRLIAEKLGNDVHELSSRVLNSINHKYSHHNTYTNKFVFLFSLDPETKATRVNFTLLTGVLADRIEARKDAMITKWWPLGVSIFSAVIALTALATGLRDKATAAEFTKKSEAASIDQASATPPHGTSAVRQDAAQ